jgi:hypothetical protein
LGGGEYQAEGGGVLQAGELFGFHIFLFFLEHRRVKRLRILEQVPQDARLNPEPKGALSWNP